MASALLKMLYFVALPKEIQNIEYIESNFYVAAALQRYKIQSTIEIRAPDFNKKKLKEKYKNTKFEVGFRSLPVNFHQRSRIISITNNTDEKISKKRKEYGETQLSYVFSQKQARAKIKIKAEVSLYSTTYFFSEEVKKEYFKSNSVAKDLLKYIDHSQTPKSLLKKVENFQKKHKKKIKGDPPCPYP